MEQLKKQPIFDITAPNKSTRIVNGECSGILNWDDIRMPKMYKLYKVLIGNHWIPDEIPMNADKMQFEEELSEQEQTAYLKIIGLLGVLDSMQSMYVADVKDYLTDSSLQAICGIIGQQEIIHNQSYTYVLSSIADYETQKEVFEYWKTDEVLLKRNLFIRELYQDFRDNPTPQTFFKSLVADIILEGLDFYTGFAFFYSLARVGSQRMMRTAEMASYIQRDERQHVYFFSEVFKQLLKDYPELNTEENMQWTVETFRTAVDLEIAWSHHVLGELDNVDLDEFESYVKWVANQRLVMMGLGKHFEGENVMPWIRPFSDEALNATKTDFFEAKSKQYAKVSTANGFDKLQNRKKK
ncbi:ribonucleoside-diphosphate reductase class Ib beta subunit [Paenibacillus sp. PDC88]|nr:ribonucleoside-diphosphate reductase class Ib beta subunit [Paenibacillus sp. PDC88]